MEIYAVIMAGGVGSRFWPRSRERSPKQLLRIFGENTMIQNSVSRLSGLIDNDHIYIITNALQREEIIRQLPDLNPENIIAEPQGRNTAACVGLAAAIIHKKSPNAVSIVLPADHLISEEEQFRESLRKAASLAEKTKGLITIGIRPNRPETGYGYIQVGEKLLDERFYRVNSFAEKPNYATAVRFLESGDFYWNSGMFIWRVADILDEIKLYLPELHSSLQKLEGDPGTEDFSDSVDVIYSEIKSISIDYGVMEKSRKVYLIMADFNWSDVGSWEEVYQRSEKQEQGNVQIGNVFAEMTLDSYIYSPQKFTAVIGMENVIVINTDDSLLVCRRDQAQDVKKVVDYLKHNKLNEYI
ncbi:MAG: NTP transferase domain-containing protein [Ignavibacteriaceae bacterium]|nr:NTP transferase domain-containing protein [Ignavibacteriaceae bacterium]